MPGRIIRHGGPSPSSARSATPAKGIVSPEQSTSNARPSPRIHGQAVLRADLNIPEPQGFTVQFPSGGGAPTTISTATLQAQQHQSSGLSSIPLWGWALLAIGAYYAFK